MFSASICCRVANAVKAQVQQSAQQEQNSADEAFLAQERQSRKDAAEQRAAILRHSREVAEQMTSAEAPVQGLVQPSHESTHTNTVGPVAIMGREEEIFDDHCSHLWNTYHSQRSSFVPSREVTREDLTRCLLVFFMFVCILGSGEGYKRVVILFSFELNIHLKVSGAVKYPCLLSGVHTWMF